MGISVRMVYMPYTDYMTIAGMQMAFDFTDDVGEGESILAHTVGLSFFQVRYATNSTESCEEVGQVGVTMIPNQVGSMIYYTPNLILTDFDGSGGAEAQDATSLNSYIWATCVAYIGTSLSDQTAVLGTAYGLSSTGSSAITLSASNPSTYWFISGFNTYISPLGQSQEISQLSVNAKSNTDGNTITLNGVASLSSDDPSVGTVDVGLISTSGITNYAIDAPSVSWGDTSGESGQTADISSTFTIPEGYSKIAYAGLLLNNVTLNMDQDYVQEIEFGLLSGGLTISGDTVTGIVTINMWNTRDKDHYLSSGTLDVYVIVQFA